MARTSEFQQNATLFKTTRLCAQMSISNVNMAVLKHVRFTAMLPSLLCDEVQLNGTRLKRYYLRRIIVAALK